jgi:hypothetical protein
MIRTVGPRQWVAALGALAIVVTGCGSTAAPTGSTAAATSGASAATGSSGSPAGSPGASGATEWSRAYEGTSLSMIAEATLNSQVLESLLPDFTT